MFCLVKHVYYHVKWSDVECGEQRRINDVFLTLAQVFHTDDYELLVLQKGHCPYCRKHLDEPEVKTDALNGY